MVSGTLIRNTLIVFIILVTFSACTGVSETQFTPDGTETEIIDTSINPTTTTGIADLPTSTTPTSGLQPSIRTEMVSSDPGSVELASGKIQLVEFFAFW
jgi:hypothetical protein